MKLKEINVREFIFDKKSSPRAKSFFRTPIFIGFEH
jgi:hypothetical protein